MHKLLKTREDRTRANVWRVLSRVNYMPMPFQKWAIDLLSTSVFGCNNEEKPQEPQELPMVLPDGGPRTIPAPDLLHPYG